jgi:hypothetical protein
MTTRIGSFVCGSVDRTDGERMVIDGCIEKSLHGGDE